MVGVMMAVALATLDTAIANTALPTFAADLGSIRVLPYGS
jgi:DHA2 family multidrug resistance protein-like MFS transporter